MTTPEEKFRKLLAAYEDEVQRKQHKMGKKVDPTDEAQPNPSSGYCTFLRHGQQVVWSPSFDIIGTFDEATSSWTWGWADQTLDPRIRSRMDGVRKQGVTWGIDTLTNGLMTLASEQQAWELATVATAVSNADAMYRLIEAREGGRRIRFLALFDGPPPSRSTLIRAPSSSNIPVAIVRNTPYPGIANPTGSPVVSRRDSSASGSNPALQRVSTNPGLQRVQTRPTSNVPPKMAISPTTANASGPEPTDATRAEIGQRMFETMTTSQQGELGTVNLLARALPPSGPLGSVALETKIVLKPRNGPEEALAGNPQLNDALVALWNRCRDRNGNPYKFATARLESSPQGLVTHVFLEF
jgi:hypothetical protein